MIYFYSQHLLARHVSGLTGPSSGASFYKQYVQIWYVVIRVLLDASSRNTDGRIAYPAVVIIEFLLYLTFQSLRITSCNISYDSQKLCSAHTVHLYALCGSENKQRLFPYTALTDWFV
jgi:hypothetical protein